MIFHSVADGQLSDNDCPRLSNNDKSRPILRSNLNYSEQQDTAAWHELRYSGKQMKVVRNTYWG